MIHRIDSSPEAFLSSKANTLTKEDWQGVADGLIEAGPYLVKICEEMAKNNKEVARIVPALSPSTMEAYLHAAVVACAYVSEYAADQVKFLLVKDGEKN
ncbi:MAG: hypothetical protein IKN04_13485 [Clostridia bacterium]|nr:hypothetical protein [Clostridia bacterium]